MIHRIYGKVVGRPVGPSIWNSHGPEPVTTLIKAVATFCSEMQTACPEHECKCERVDSGDIFGCRLYARSGVRVIRFDKPLAIRVHENLLKLICCHLDELSVPRPQYDGIGCSKLKATIYRHCDIMNGERVEAILVYACGRKWKLGWELYMRPRLVALQSGSGWTYTTFTYCT